MDVSPYIERWRERAASDERAVADAAARARAVLPGLVAMLRESGARRVWLVGSLARGTFRPGSDVDVLVEGIDDRAAARISTAASEATGVAVDVLPAEMVDRAWREYLVRYGEVLHA